MKKLVLGVAVAAATVGSMESGAQQYNPWQTFELLKQTIECVRKPGTDYLTCSNKQVSDDTQSTSEPVVQEPVRNTDGNQYWARPVDIVIPREAWPVDFEGTKERYPDFASWGKPWVKAMDAIDFNGDGLMDILVKLEHNRDTRNEVEVLRNNGEWTDNGAFSDTFDSLAFMCQRQEGEYELCNEEITGQTYNTVGATSAKRSVADINSDGYLDIVYAGMGEDGRRPRTKTEPGEPKLTTWQVQQRAVMSNGDGTYRIDNLGDLQTYGGANTVAHKQNGDVDIIYGSYDNSYVAPPDERFMNGHRGPARAFTYIADTQYDVSDEYQLYLARNSFIASEPAQYADGYYSKYLMVTDMYYNGSRGNMPIWDPIISMLGNQHPGIGPDGGYGMFIFKQENGRFVPHAASKEWPMIEERFKYVSHYEESNGDDGWTEDEIRTNSVSLVDGMLVRSMNTSRECSLMLNENEPVFLTMIDGYLLPSDIDFTKVHPIGDDEGAAQEMRYWKAYTIRNGEIVTLDNIFDELRNDMSLMSLTPTKIDPHCGDLNNDGLGDFASNSQGIYDEERQENDIWPKLYINNGEEDLVLTEMLGKDEIEFTNWIPETQKPSRDPYWDEANKETYVLSNGRVTDGWGSWYDPKGVAMENSIKDMNGDGIADFVHVGKSGAVHRLQWEGEDLSNELVIRVQYGIQAQQVALDD